MIPRERLDELVEEDEFYGYDRITDCGGPAYLNQGAKISKLALDAAIEADSASRGHEHDDFHRGQLLVGALARTFPSATKEEKREAIYRIPFRMYMDLLERQDMRPDITGSDAAENIYDGVRELVTQVREDLSTVMTYTLDMTADKQVPIPECKRLCDFFLTFCKLARTYGARNIMHYSLSPRAHNLRLAISGTQAN